MAKGHDGDESPALVRIQGHVPISWPAPDRMAKSEVRIGVGLSRWWMEADDDPCSTTVAAGGLQLERTMELAPQGGTQIGYGPVEERHISHCTREAFELLWGSPASLNLDELKALGRPGDAHPSLEIGSHQLRLAPHAVRGGFCPDVLRRSAHS